MSATNLYINWTSVGFTPSGGSLVAIGKVTAVKFNRNGSPEAFKGDASRFATAVAVPSQDRTVEVDTGDVGAASGLTVGSVGTLVATLNDALNGAAVGGGGRTYTLANAVLCDNPFEGSHAKYGSAKLMFSAFSSDGTTDPLTSVAL